MNAIIHAVVFIGQVVVFIAYVAWVVEQTFTDPGFWPLYLPLLVLLQASAMLIVLAVMTGMVLHRKVRH